MAAQEGESPHFIINMISATDVPRADIIGHADPYLVGWICTPPTGSSFERIGETLLPESPLVNSDALQSIPIDTGKKSKLAKIRNRFRSSVAFTPKDIAACQELRTSPLHRTDRVYSHKDPIWNCIRDFQVKPTDKDLLILVLYDWDATNKDDLLGAVAIPVSLLSDYKPIRVSFSLFVKQTRGLGTCSLNLTRLETPSPFPVKKTLFLIRHGESQWNQAQEKKNVVGMIKTTDHGLNPVGIQQAQAFNSKWKALSTDTSPRVQQFLSATCAFASPLTRATQTALLTLKDHPVQSRSKIILLPSMREAKNLGGLDTIGKKFGEEIPQRVASELSAVLSPSEVAALGLYTVPEPTSEHLNLDLYRCSQPWWTPKGIKEGPKVISRRIYDFITTIQLSHPEAENVICVGHSLFFKEFVKKYLADSFAAANPEFATKLKTYKLGNAACLAVDVEFSSNPDAPVSITGAELMFGSDFHYE